MIQTLLRVLSSQCSPRDKDFGHKNHHLAHGVNAETLRDGQRFSRQEQIYPSRTHVPRHIYKLRTLQGVIISLVLIGVLENALDAGPVLSEARQTGIRKDEI